MLFHQIGIGVAFHRTYIQVAHLSNEWVDSNACLMNEYESARVLQQKPALPPGKVGWRNFDQP